MKIAWMSLATVAVTLSLPFPVAVAAGNADLPRVGFVTKSPFGVDGTPVASVWKTADVCERFLEVISHDVALDQSEVRMLFDDRNLYVELTGFFDAAYDRGNRERSIGSGNNFEFFVSLGGNAYFHVIVDEFGRLYVARSAEVTEQALPRHGVTAKVERGKGVWTAWLTIPFADLGVGPPVEGIAAKVGIFRNNINVHERAKVRGVRQSASGFAPNDHNYRARETWTDVAFTRTARAPRRVRAPNRGVRVNLLPNPDFTVPGRVWRAAGAAAYCETMAMSGEWTFCGTGRDPRIMSGPVDWMSPSTRYTLVVKARGLGNGGALRVVEIVRDGEGRARKRPLATVPVSVGKDMREYFVPFTSDPGTPWRMAFERTEGGESDVGLQIAAVRCYEGDVSSFEVRTLVRSGRKAIIPGTEPAPVANPYGRFPKPIRILALVESKYNMREPREIFAGTGADVDVLLLSGQDVYSTYGEAKRITERIEKSGYDLIMVPALGAGRIGVQLARHIRRCVEAGAGLYLEEQGDLGHLGEALGHVVGGRLGKGCVERASMAGTGYQHCEYLPPQSDDERAKSLFPVRETGLMRVAAAAWRAAAGDSAENGAVRVERRNVVYAGFRHVFEKRLTAEGATCGWSERVTALGGPVLGEFADDGVVSTVAVTGSVAGVSLLWELRDFSGRTLASGETPAASNTSFAVPRGKLYTNFGGIRLVLRRNGEDIDVRGESIFVRGNDRARLMDDYTPSMWPGMGSAEEMRQLEEIGIRSSVLPCGGGMLPAFTVASGFGCGSHWLAADFCGRPQKSRVRAPSVSTAAWRRDMSLRIRGGVRAISRYGLLDSALCDEPNLVLHGAGDELDEHPENVAEYRTRMKRKYGTITEYNRRHETDLKSFDEIGPTLQADARRTGKIAPFVEWRTFNVDRWCEAIRLVSDSARAVDPEAPFTMCDSFGQSALSGNDYWKLLTRAGLGFSTEYTAMVYFNRSPIWNFDELLRSFRPDMRVWGYTGYFMNPERMRFLPWWTACHRYGGFSWYAATSRGFNLIDPETLAFAVDGAELRKSLADTRMLDGLGKTLTCWSWAPRDIAIYYSHESMLVSTILGTETKNCEVAAQGPLHDFMHSRQGAQYTVEDLLYQHDFIAPEQIVESNRLAGVKALFMPRIVAMSDAEVTAVSAWLARGGRMICDCLPGDRDELGVRRAKNPFAGLSGVEVTGTNFDDLDRMSRARTKAFLESAGATKVLACSDMVGHPGREAMHYVSGKADLYCVIRMPDRSADDDLLDFSFAKPGHLYDVRAGRYLGVAGHISAKVPMNEGCVFAVLPAKIESVSVLWQQSKGPVTRGEDVSIDLAVGSDDVSADYVLHVEFVPPSGRVPRFHMMRNISTKNGRAHLDFAMALNDEPGEWTVRVREPLTGVVGVSKFTLK